MVHLAFVCAQAHVFVFPNRVVVVGSRSVVLGGTQVYLLSPEGFRAATSGLPANSAARQRMIADGHEYMDNICRVKNHHEGERMMAAMIRHTHEIPSRDPINVAGICSDIDGVLDVLVVMIHLAVSPDGNRRGVQLG